jgi:predicted GNAT family acetyltransferase
LTPLHGTVHERAIKKYMHIQHEESDIRGRHFITDPQGNMLAEITYAVRHPDTMVVDHTEVKEDLRDQNIGHQLIEAVAEHARAKGRHIIPVCPFVRSIMEQNSAFQDVVRLEEINE